MATVIHLQTDDALDAIRAGARRAIRDALSQETNALATLSAAFDRAYLLKEWLTVTEVAAYVGCDAESAEGRAKAVRKMHNAGLRYVVTGRQRLTSRADLEAWLQEQPRVGRPGRCAAAR